MQGQESKVKINKKNNLDLNLQIKLKRQIN